jgi:hypothetical protein
MNRIGGILRDTPQKIRSRPQVWEATEISQEPIESTDLCGRSDSQHIASLKPQNGSVHGPYVVKAA